MADKPIKGAPAMADKQVKQAETKEASEAEKVHSLAEIRALCAGIWAAHNSRFTNLDGKPWPEWSDGLAVVSKYGDSWTVREDFTKRLKHELALLRCATIALTDGDSQAEERAVYAARGVVQIIDAGA